MAHIRKHPNTGKHQVRWRDPAPGKEQNRSFIRATDAQAFKRKIEAAIDQGNYIDSCSEKTRFGACADDWFANKLHLRPASRARDEAYLRNRVLPAFGDLAVGQVRKSHVQQWIQDLRAKDLAPATIKECSALRRACLKKPSINA